MTTKTLGRPRTSKTRDLREDPLRTSRELLGEDGSAALSIWGVAHHTDRTHQAPYHHFANRETILATLVEAGFDKLTNRLHETWDKAGTENLRAVVEASGNACAEFALTNPGVFRVMFRRDICGPAWSPGVLATNKRARDELDRFTQVITGERTTPEHEAALWVSVRGLTVLPLDGFMTGELPALEYRLTYARRVNQLDAGALMSSGKGEERDGPDTWFW